LIFEGYRKADDADVPGLSAGLDKEGPPPGPVAVGDGGLGSSHSPGLDGTGDAMGLGVGETLGETVGVWVWVWVVGGAWCARAGYSG
jgi:hypothetical protein